MIVREGALLWRKVLLEGFLIFLLNLDFHPLAIIAAQWSSWIVSIAQALGMVEWAVVGLLSSLGVIVPTGGGLLGWLCYRRANRSVTNAVEAIVSLQYLFLEIYLTRNGIIKASSRILPVLRV